MVLSKLKQCVLISAVLVAFSSATPQVLQRRITSLEEKRRLSASTVEEQIAFAYGRDDESEQRPFVVAPSARAKFYTFDNVWLGGEANETITGEDFLELSHFGILDAAEAAKKGFLNISDTDCAATFPNALHNFPNNFTSASVIRSNATALAEQGLSEFFDVVAFTWKPMGPATPGTYITMDLWKVDTTNEEGDATYMDGLFNMWFAKGYLPRHTLVPGQWWEGWGEGVNWVEIASRSGENKAWDFCLDNLVLLFHAKDEGE